MFRELKGSYRYIVLIFALLFGQAFMISIAIVHFGYYQCGCTAGWYSGQCAGSDLRSSMDQLFLFMDSDQQQEVKECYTLKDGVYTHKKLKEEERDSLNTIFGKSMLAVS